MTEYKINRCVNKIEVYFSFTYIKSRRNQPRTGVADQTFIWDLASTFLVTLTSLLYMCLVVQPPCQHFSQQERGCDEEGHTSSLWGLYQISHSTFPFMTLWAEFSLVAKTSWLRNAIVISTVGRTYTKGKAKKTSKLLEEFRFLEHCWSFYFLSHFILYIIGMYNIFFKRFIRKKICGSIETILSPFFPERNVFLLFLFFLSRRYLLKSSL